MKYLKVMGKYDNLRLSRPDRRGCRVWDGILVGNELYTVKEWERLKERTKMNLDYTVEPVEINRNKTHWFFGARFENNLL